MNAEVIEVPIEHVELVHKFMGRPGNAWCTKIDWNEVMIVADDILYSRRFHTGAQTTEISNLGYRLWKNVERGLLNLSVEQVWLALVKFITWYNKEQNPKPSVASKAAKSSQR